MNFRTNRVAHYKQGNSDKLYIVSILLDGIDFIVRAKWGRNPSPRQQQTKSVHSSLESADRAADDLFRKKLAKGYQDIEHPSYGDGVTLLDVGQWLEPEIDSSTDLVSETSLPDVREPEHDDVSNISGNLPVEFVVVCVNAGGIEDRFDEGASYSAEMHPESDMVYVHDKYGERDEWFRDRFVRADDLKKVDVVADARGMDVDDVRVEMAKGW